MRALLLWVTLLVLFGLAVPASSDTAPTTPTQQEEQVIELKETASATADEYVSMPQFSQAGETLVRRMGDGWLRLVNNESPQWYECGVMTPKEDKAFRAEKLARYTLDALREHNLPWLNPWSILAVMYRESRGDQCAIGPRSREAARELGLIPADKKFNQWTKDDVVNLMNNPKWKKSRSIIGADLGLGQQVWERYARILAPEGKDTCGGRNYKCRVPTIDEILSVEVGPRVVVTGMLSRSRMYHTQRPWEFWPGRIKSPYYDMHITALAHQLGGKDDEKAVW